MIFLTKPAVKKLCILTTFSYYIHIINYKTYTWISVDYVERDCIEEKLRFIDDSLGIEIDYFKIWNCPIEILSGSNILTNTLNKFARKGIDNILGKCQRYFFIDDSFFVQRQIDFFTEFLEYNFFAFIQCKYFM